MTSSPLFISAGAVHGDLGAHRQLGCRRASALVMRPTSSGLHPRKDRRAGQDPSRRSPGGRRSPVAHGRRWRNARCPPARSPHRSGPPYYHHPVHRRRPAFPCWPRRYTFSRMAASVAFNPTRLATTVVTTVSRLGIRRRPPEHLYRPTPARSVSCKRTASSFAAASVITARRDGTPALCPFAPRWNWRPCRHPQAQRSAIQGSDGR